MAIIIILVVLLVVLTALAVVFGIIYKNKSKFEKTAKNLIAFAIISLILLISVSIVAGTLGKDESKYNALDSRYEQLEETYNFYKVRRNSETSGVDAWLAEVYDYNNTVLMLRAQADNVWDNAFVNKDRVEKLKLIVFENGYPVFE